jgi:reverse gyrase
MSKYKKCPTCSHKASGGLFGGVYIKLHKCNKCEKIFCNECKSGKFCPRCDSSDIWWNYDEAYKE